MVSDFDSLHSRYAADCGAASSFHLAPPLPEGVEAVMREAAARAGGIQLELIGHVNIEYKGTIDLVTEADRRSEAAVVAAIRERFPDHAILAEESGASGGTGARKSSGDPANALPGAGWRWVIDPLDGTTNYAHRLPVFAVSIALQHNGETQAACVFAPALNELYLAFRGAGATVNGAPLRVSSETALQRSLLATGFPYDRALYARHYLELVEPFLAHSRGVIRWGAAAIDLCHVAAGKLEGYWEEKLHPWDTAAGLLIVEEAGGRVTRFDGTPYNIFDKDILATNGRVHDAMMEILAPHAPPPGVRA